MEKIRVFLAIPLSEEIKELLFTYNQNFGISDIRPTLKENLHITVHFFGDIDKEELNSYISEVEKMVSSFNIFDLKSDTLRVKKSRRSMIWATFFPSVEFNDLALSIKKQFQSDDLRINPHITIARFKKIGHETITIPFLPDFLVPVKKIELWQSPESDERPGYYKSLASFYLKDYIP